MNDMSPAYSAGDHVVVVETLIGMPSIDGVLTLVETWSDEVLYAHLVEQVRDEDDEDFDEDDPPAYATWRARVWSREHPEGRDLEVTEDEIVGRLPAEMFDLARAAGWPREGVPGHFTLTMPALS